MTISYQSSTSSSSSSSSSLVVSSSNPSLVVSTTISSSLNSSTEEYHKRLFHKKMACAAANIADFIKRLYRMLEDKSYAHIVSWGMTGDTFVVHDPTEFAKSILPQHFKHNNMASFVRQLNKYDFHKIKSNDDDARPYNEQAWEFQHPKFQLNRKDLLEDIKRKIPTPRNKNNSKQNVLNIKSENKHNNNNNNNQEESDDGTSSITSIQPNISDNTNNVHSISTHSSVNIQYDLHSQVESLTELHADLAGHINTLSRNCGTILEEIITFKRNLAAQDSLLSNLYQILAQQLNNNNNNNNNNTSRINSSIQQQQQQQQPPTTTNNTTTATTTSTNNIITNTTTTDNNGSSTSNNRRYSSISLNSPINSTNTTSTHDFHNSGGLPSSFMSSIQENLMLDTLIRSSTSITTTPTDNNASTNLSPVETSSSILPLMNEMLSGAYAAAVNAAQQTTLNLNQFTTPNPSPPITTTTNNRLFFRGEPNWSIQPKVLFVDDELSIREGGSQWFQAYGCQFDLASDGITAVNKMHIQQYDIVFMDTVLQNEFNGLSVTQQIRSFNTTVPIIGMPPSQSSSNNNQSTNNSTDTSNYLNYSGMDDLLPKPFTRQDLYAKIDKFCGHLKSTNVLVSSSQNDSDNSTTIQQQQQQQVGIRRQSRTLSSISSNLNATNAVTSAQDTTQQQQQQQHQINYLSASHIDLYRQQQTAAGQIHRLSDDDVDDLAINSKSSRKKKIKY